MVAPARREPVLSVDISGREAAPETVHALHVRIELTHGQVDGLAVDYVVARWRFITRSVHGAEIPGGFQCLF